MEEKKEVKDSKELKPILKNRVNVFVINLLVILMFISIPFLFLGTGLSNRETEGAMNNWQNDAEFIKTTVINIIKPMENEFSELELDDETVEQLSVDELRDYLVEKFGPFLDAINSNSDGLNLSQNINYKSTEKAFHDIGLFRNITDFEDFVNNSTAFKICLEKLIKGEIDAQEAEQVLSDCEKKYLEEQESEKFTDITIE